ncbi:transketolase [Devosia sp. 63-57]|uniref:transketolase n=1 Tax=Devosia sp. 63-57 TaxID=1895751 RepID=UPI00086BCFB0|nr:transketolase [Devosia sp. 63-57]ODT48799.1 MAG: transketolase [Pelagibacterium sp. SCN 63-126]ODU86912.1 MAG: transketolase [Pelagibacterium sp. SCN 63-17]OJX44273.1 MAG: transketolase [Devosia sp. 63-57]
MTNTTQQNELANAIRSLSMDAVEKANSGHPGLPMGCADIATVLFTKVMKFDPANPHWADRDRFILSAGHGSMLLYSSLYLLGYEDMTIDQVKNFRQLGAKTAGHPEYGHATGIETTTGPLGAGLGNSVGFAVAEAKLAAEFGSDIVDHHTFVLAGDGCLMEGISQEAISLAGHLKLNKLIVIWDNNNITIDGKVSNADSTDQIARFKAVGWNTIEIDGHDQDAIEKALLEAKASTDKPTLIAAKTTIGFGAPKKAGTEKVHGAPLGAEELAGAKAALGIDYPAFEIPSHILEAWRAAGTRSQNLRGEWEARLAKSDKKDEFTRRMSGTLPSGFADAFTAYKKKLAEDKPKVASRKASQMALEVITKTVPEILAGSADLTHSNLTNTPDTVPFQADNHAGNYMMYGIREHEMGAAMNGVTLHGGLIPYGGTFMVFTDYARPAIRLAALMEIRSIFVMTHDSIGLGEDGPTHQPVEHLTALRAIPNLNVFRPADAMETAECWELAMMAAKTPSILALSRQNLPAVRTEYSAENKSAKGAYTLVGPADADAVIFATGSEVAIAVEAQKELTEKGISARVVSVPSMELFAKQSDAYKAEVIGKAKARVAVEAGIEMSWNKLLGDKGKFVGMHSFGASGPIDALYAHFGITPKAVVEAVTSQL